MKMIRTSRARRAAGRGCHFAALERRGGASLDSVLPAVKRIVADVRKQGDRAPSAMQPNSTASKTERAYTSRKKKWQPHGRRSIPR